MTWLSNKTALWMLLLIQVIGACCCWVEWGHEHNDSEGTQAALVWAGSAGSCHEHDDVVRAAPVPQQVLTQLPSTELLPVCLDALIPHEMSMPWRLTSIPDRLTGTLPPAICLPLLT